MLRNKRTAIFQQHRATPRFFVLCLCLAAILTTGCANHIDVQARGQTAVGVGVGSRGGGAHTR
ncbi:hypothetical protein [Candidatus Desulfovibrio trichonymphae]|uniref:hypothetical protein n=1 Tax=Candidatus Desulfovibrio trichonymphae TaxID=1725232 RepID=UPI000BBA84A4|nr:hypothetical protein [Candidatus Desulfovibrio trichonymphae]